MSDAIRGRLLVVEDEPVIATLMHEVFTRGGYQVEVAGQVSVAIEQLGKQTFDLCLSDFMLPDRTGLDLARAALEIQPELRMVLISAFMESEVERQVREIPSVLAIVRKPADVFKLRDQVDEWVPMPLAEVAESESSVAEAPIEIEEPPSAEGLDAGAPADSSTVVPVDIPAPRPTTENDTEREAEC